MSGDDEVCAVLLWQWIQLACIEDNVRSVWVHPINKKRMQENTLRKFISELRRDEKKFRNFTRLRSSSFDYILNKLKDKITKQDTNLRKSITPEERLFVTLRYLALGERFQSLHFYFRIGATTIGKLVEATCTALWDVFSPIYMSLPSTEKWEDIAQRSHRLWNFPNCLGAIDGKHIRIQCLPNSGSSYFNYKDIHSIVLRAVVDADAKFVLFVDVGDYGRNCDSAVFRNSNFGKLFFEQKLNLPSSRKLCAGNDFEFPFVFVADEAYPLSEKLMRPFPRKNLTPQKRIYNYRLSRARRIVECAFGMVSKKFRILENVMLVGPDKATRIVLACCILHNIIREKEGTVRDIHDALLECEESNDETQCNPRRTNSGLNVRMKFLDYFCSEDGAISWQNKYAYI